MTSHQPINLNMHDTRPWGQYWVLEDSNTHKVKRIEVSPGGRLSYQYHHHRSEVWTIVSGVARITLEGIVCDFQPGQVIQIPQGSKHRVENPGKDPLTIIEVQLGSYFGEDDIVRIEDDYQRN